MVRLTYWMANSEVAILFCDLSLGSKSDISGSFGTFLADIGGIFLNELTKHFTSNLFFSFVFLQSVFVLAILLFHFSFGSKSIFFVCFGTFSAHIGVFFLNQLPNRVRSNLSFSFSFFFRSLSFLLTFSLVQTMSF